MRRRSFKNRKKLSNKQQLRQLEDKVKNVAISFGFLIACSFNPQ